MGLKWLIYCRVSSKKQVNEWNWLSSQEKRCRDYAVNTLWVEVEKVFNDEWVSWWVFERKSIKELLKYIDNNKKSSYIVIFEDLNRLSRDIQVHNLLKAEFRKRWIELACPNFQFENSPEWTFRENMSVSMAQYEKDKNKQRVNDRMRARLEQWFWCFKVPIWYKYSTNSKWWKEILIDEEKAGIIKIAFEKFANNELENVNDVVRFLNNKWIKNWTIKNWKVYSSDLAHRLLRNILYTWFLEFPKWNIWKIKAKHKAIISLKLFEKVQFKLNNFKEINNSTIIEKSNNRIDRSEDFPLRWFLFCQTSNLPLSWARSQWQRQKFPYYTFNRKSELFWKSINRDIIHKQLENILKNIQPKEDLISAFEETIKYIIKNKEQEKFEIQKNNEKEIKNIDNKINNFLDRIWNTENEILISNYEKKIEELNDLKNQILQKYDLTVKNFRTPLENKLKLVRNSLEIWKKWDLEIKRKLIKNIFPNWIFIDEKKQVRTPTFSLIYQSFQVWKESISNMVGHPGFEPRTFSLKGSCSTCWANNPNTLLLYL